MNLTVPDTLRGLPESLELVETLYQGRERSVHRVCDRIDSVTRVLKLVHADAAGEGRQSLIDEFLLLDRIKHPHLVKVFRFLHLSDGGAGYLMEDLRPDEPQDPEAPGWAPRDPEAARSLLGALHNLHAIGFAHLDLKPGQVLRGPRGVALIDLGLAAPIGSPLPARGTWGFIAPEILSQQPWDRRADIYSIGCLLVNVWTGESPLGGGEIAEQVRRQLKRPTLRLRERVVGFPEGLDRVIEALLDPDPEKRPSDAPAAWQSIHTMAGARERYLERQRLPLPDAVPLVLQPGIEASWQEALRAHADVPWVIEGPPGSGRHRLLARMRAIAETNGCRTSGSAEDLTVEYPPFDGAKPNGFRSRVGRAQRGDRQVALEVVGEEQAQAALEAYALAPEGGEAGWTLALLQARINERVGGEEARRASVRVRRSLAAAQGSCLPEGERSRLAAALAAAPGEEPPAAGGDDPLVRGGWLKVGAGHRLVPACPPWDPESLRSLVGESDMKRAHRALSNPPPGEPVAAARHALGAMDPEAVLSLVPAALSALRSRGDLVAAIGMLDEARRLLGNRFPAEWLALHAALALEDGSPARCAVLLRAENPALSGEWRTLIMAHLHNRAGRRQEALELALPLGGEDCEARVRRAAGAIVVRALVSMGETGRAVQVARPLLATGRDGVSVSERMRLAYLVFAALNAQGKRDKDYAEARGVLEGGLTAAGERERLVAAGALGVEAFRRGDLESAQRLFEGAHQAAQALGDSTQVVATRVNLGGVYFEKGMLAESEDLNRLALADYEQLQDQMHEALTRRNLATIMESEGRWGEALDLARGGREGLEKVGAQDEADSALGLEVVILVDAGLLRAANERCAQLADRLKILPQPIVEAILLRDRGRIARLEGDRAAAGSLWKQSAVVSGELHAVDERLRTLLEWAAAEVAWDDLSEAERLLDLARERTKELGAGDIGLRLAFTQCCLLMALADSKTTEETEVHLRQAAAQASRSGLRLWAWRCHAALAGLASKTGRPSEALAATREAREALRELLEAIRTPALQESYVMLPDPRLFLAWCERDLSAIEEVPIGSSDLEVFLR